MTSVLSTQRWSEAALDLFLGQEPRQRLWVQRTLSAAALYLVAVGLIVRSVSAGLVPAQAAYPVVLYVLCGAVPFYLLLRSGWSRRCDDPALTLPQVLHGLGAIVLCYTLIPIGRTLTLPMLSLALTFALLSRLSPRQTMACGLAAAVMMIGAFAFTYQRHAGMANLTQEGLNLIMAALTLPVFASVTRQVKEWRARLDAQKAELDKIVTDLRALAEKDQLTGLVNRRAMNAGLLEELLRFRRHQRPLCAAMLDVDDFKAVNDHFGHQEGDKVLVALARHLRVHFALPDSVARWGGEEFVVLLPECPPDEAFTLLDAARASFDVTVGAGTPLSRRVTFSIGLAEALAGDDPDGLLARADAALYEAKRRGKNQVVRAL